MDHACSAPVLFLKWKYAKLAKIVQGKKQRSFLQGKISHVTTRSLVRADGVIAAQKVPTETELLPHTEPSMGYKHKCEGQEEKLSSKGE